jgi:hypothetical protein
MIEFDVKLDPPAAEPAVKSKVCDFESLSRLEVRKHERTDSPVLKEKVREVLKQMSNPPERFTEEQIRLDESFLESISEHILDADKFVAGSFQTSFLAWKELLAGSKRHASKKVLK